MYDTIIVGGGASGLMCGCCLHGKVLIIEAENRVGKKILATGNGRCNLSNTDMKGEFYSSPEFFRAVTGKLECDLMDVWCEFGLFTRVDSAGRIYPFSNQASTVLDVLRKRLDSRVEIKTETKVQKAEKKGDKFTVLTNNGNYECKNLVLSCGGGKFDFVKNLGLKCTKTYPALCAIKTDIDKIKGLDGVRAHAKVSLVCGDERYSESGEVLFRKYGLSGIAVFNASSVYARAKKQGENKDFYLVLDLLDGLDKKAVKEEIQKRIMDKRDKENLLLGIIPVKIANAVLKDVGLNAEKIVNELSGVKIKCLDLLDDNAQITLGGVELDQVKPTLECKEIDGLYVLGELLDMDGLCGGYNLHWAFTTGVVCANDINNK